MFPFTSEALILTRISADQLAAMSGVDDAKLDAAIADVDALITAATAIAPAAAAADNHRVLSSIASRIVIWMLSGNVQGLADTESSRRKKDYDDAIEDLDKVRSGALALTAPSTTTVATVGSRPQRVTEY